MAKTIEVIKDRNLGNGPNTYYKAGSERAWCVKVNGELLRNARGQVRRFGSDEAAHKAGEAAIATAATPAAQAPADCPFPVGTSVVFTCADDSEHPRNGQKASVIEVLTGPEHSGAQAKRIVTGYTIQFTEDTGKLSCDREDLTLATEPPPELTRQQKQAANFGKQVVTITVAGPQGAGKTTIAQFIAWVFREEGYAVALEDEGETLPIQRDAGRLETLRNRLIAVKTDFGPAPLTDGPRFFAHVGEKPGTVVLTTEGRAHVLGKELAHMLGQTLIRQAGLAPEAEDAPAFYIVRNADGATIHSGPDAKEAIETLIRRVGRGIAATLTKNGYTVDMNALDVGAGDPGVREYARALEAFPVG